MTTEYFIEIYNTPIAKASVKINLVKRLKTGDDYSYFTDESFKFFVLFIFIKPGTKITSDDSIKYQKLVIHLLYIN